MSADKAVRAFVDTNVLVYAHDRSAGSKRLRAKALLARLWESDGGCLSTQVLQEFYVVVTQKIRRPLERSTARQLVADLGHWHVHAPQVEDVLAAVDLQETAGLSFWDALIVQSAVQLGCAQLWSEDLNAGQLIAGVRIVNPFATHDEA